MRDLLLLLVVGVMFVGGYFLMDRLDRFLENLHIEEETLEENPEPEISQPAQVENPCLLCYNDKCEKRVRYPATRPGGQEEQIWKQPGRIRTCFCVPSGKIAKHRES